MAIAPKKKIALYALSGLCFVLLMAASLGDCGLLDKVNYHPAWRKSCWKTVKCHTLRCDRRGCDCRHSTLWNPSEQYLLTLKAEIEQKSRAQDVNIREAAERGDAIAQLTMGNNLVREEVRQEQDWTAAFKWYKKAAVQGDPAGLWFVGFAYLTGTGVKKDPREGNKWILKAAHAGDPAAQSALAMNYKSGHGIEKNLVESYFWDELHTIRSGVKRNAFGHAHAQPDESLTEEQIKSVLKRVDEWLKSEEPKWQKWLFNYVAEWPSPTPATSQP